jgi:hypothetical protein
MNTEAENKTNEYLKGIVANLPEKPGIYQYLNAEGTIIYVGKAKNLKKRVYSYFSKEHEPGKTRVLVSKIADIRYIVVNTEEDALLLENNLIKKYKPRYNVLLPFDLCTERIFSQDIQNPEDYQKRLILLWSVQPYPLDVCSAGLDKAFISVTYLFFKPHSGEHTGREVQCMPRISYKELCRTLHRASVTRRISKKHR